jgi:hypothetical protein
VVILVKFYEVENIENNENYSAKHFYLFVDFGIIIFFLLVMKLESEVTKILETQ